MNDKKKILFVMQDLEIGGAEHLRLTIENYIDKERHLTTYCCIKKEGPIGKEILKIGGNVISLNTSDKLYNFIATYKLYKLVRKLNPDIIHSALFNANFHARIIGALTRKPVIIEEHGLYIWKKWYHIFIDKFLSKFTHKIIVPSKSVKNFLVMQEKLNPDKIKVIYSCINPALLVSKISRQEERNKFNIESNDFIIGAIGKLRKEKGHDILLSAFKKVVMSNSNAKLFIAGDGLLYDTLVKQAHALSIQDRVVFLGAILNIADFLKAIDLFVMPSRSEGLGISLLEALALGLPCIASNIGGIKEVEEENGGVMLVESGNSDVLAAAILNQIKKNELNKNYGNQLKIKEIFMPEYYIDQIEKIYNGIN